MATERFEVEPEQPYREKSKSGGCLKGCLIAAVVFLVAILLLGIWVSNNWQRWAADLASEVLNQMIDDSELPGPEKVEVKEQVARLTDGFRDGNISGDQLGTIMELILDSPLFTSVIVASIEKKYIEPSGLEDAEKEEGRVALRRFVRGMISHKISEDDFEEAMSKIADKQPDDEWQMRESVTDEQLRELIQLVKENSDAAEIPAEVEEVDHSEEIRRIIDTVLGEGEGVSDGEHIEELSVEAGEEKVEEEKVEEEKVEETVEP